MSVNHWSVKALGVDHPDAVGLLRDYTAEVAGRYYGRTISDPELDEYLAEEPADGVAVFLVALWQGKPVGCVGLRRLGPEMGELTKVFIRPGARGEGGGAQLIAAVETAALELGLTVLRLDTRADLVEARALYARHGYREIPAYNNSPFADHWFEKLL
ncbi:GNAT family N-acetyltransferase [Nocardia sp. NPDC051030]|uniref:GNAT family N-acetyltransferase n=1 Tax=Nocardia sp. NPDC051030 TaxID=3155162 RepID=UPI0034480DBD